MAVCGGITTIGYLNLTTTGLSFWEYLQFISRRVECYLVVVGLAMIWFSIYYPSMRAKKE
ncbi:hypothetical protein [Bacillus sp. JJ1566]|uniref:hypothetical protein n=1 Tax=Bacillus sp. JJ1566 TaxID=3122961 RepID=UPI003F68A2AA